MKTTKKFYRANRILNIIAVTAICFFGSNLTSAEKTDNPKGSLPELKDGETVTKKEFRQAKMFTSGVKQVDTGRLQATYIVGKTYVNNLKVAVNSKGSYTDWGVTTDMKFNYGAEFLFSRKIESNDGKLLTAVLFIERATAITVFSKLQSMNIELPGVFQLLLEGGGVAVGATPGWTVVSTSVANEALNSDYMKSYADKLLADESAKVRKFIDGLQGKKARVVFENGIGVVEITPIGCSLNSDEQSFIESICLCSDITMMDKLDCKPGDKWEVDGQNFFPLFDPSIKAKVGGTVSIVRKENVESSKNGTEALLEMAGGAFKLNDTYVSGDGYKMKKVGTWAPTGKLIFNFEKGIVTEAVLEGDIDLTKESMDHVFFQMRDSVKPQYQVKYSAWIEEGELKATPCPKRTVKSSSTLDSMIKRVSPK